MKNATIWPQGMQAGSPVTIDHHWTTAPEKLSEVSVLHMGASDHALISAVRYAKHIKTIPQYVTKRSYKKFNSQKFLEEVRLIKWWDVYKCENVNDAVEIFTKLLCTILDKDDMAPMKTFQQRRK